MICKDIKTTPVVLPKHYLIASPREEGLPDPGVLCPGSHDSVQRGRSVLCRMSRRLSDGPHVAQEAVKLGR